MKKIAKSVTHKVEKVGEKAKSKVSSVSSAGKNGSDKGSPEGGTPEKLDNRYLLVQKYRPRGTLIKRRGQGGHRPKENNCLWQKCIIQISNLL